MKVCLKSKLQCIFILFFCIASALNAENSNNVIRVGIFDYEGYYSYDNNNNVYGYGYEYLAEIREQADVQFEFVYSSWQGCVELLEKGLIDILDTSSPTNEWKDTFLFSSYETGESHGILTTTRDSKLFLNDFNTFDEIRVGLVQNSIVSKDFIEYADENNLSYKKVYFETFSDMKEYLDEGKVDAIVTSNIRVLQDERVVAYFSYRPFYFMINKNKPHVKAIIDSALAEIRTKRPSFAVDLFQKYFGASNIVILSETELKFVKNTDPIKVVYDSNWAPFESYNKDLHIAQGLNVDLFNQIAGQTGIPFEFLHGYSYDEAIAMVVNKEADMLLSYDTNEKKAAELGVRLSETFLESPIAIVGLSYEITEDSKFAISELHPVIYEFISSRFPKNKIVKYPSIEECYKAIKDGDADFTAENVYAAMQVIRSGDYGNLLIPSITNLKDRFSFMYRNDIDQILVEILNKYITALPPEEKDTLLMTYSADTQSSFLETFFKRNAFGLLVTITFLFLVVIISFVTIVVLQIRNTRKIWSHVYVDPVTKGSSFYKFREDLEEILKNTKCYYHIFQLDINKFKLINELYGVEEGNLVLKSVNDTFSSFLCDEKHEKDKGLVARKDRDTFIILMKYEDTNKETKNGIIQEYAKIFRDKLQTSCSHKLHFSVGRYLIDPDEKDIQSILEKVNYAHGIARSKGSLDIINDYDASLKIRALRQREIETKMHIAIQDSEFQVVLQPKYELKGESICGAEALVRWPNFKPNTPLYPDEFIPLFEQNGFIIDLDYYMFTQVCILLNKWSLEGVPLIPISVNFSRLHIKNANFVNELCAIAEDYSVPKEFLEIELTETSLLEAADDTLQNMAKQLRDAGFAFVMDDFGSGYSSLGLLKDIDVDIIKLDKSFFTDNKSKEKAHIVLENILQMIKSLGMETVAEGVETKDDVEYLRSIGCNIVQGYYYSRPLVIEEFMKIYT